MLVKGIYREWINQNSILAYTVTNITGPKMNAWRKDVIDSLATWAETSKEPCRLLYDLSAPGVGLPYLILTRYEIYNVGLTNVGMGSFMDLMNRFPHLWITQALVFSKTATGTATYRHGKVPKPNSRHKFRVFTEKDDAIQWLLSSPVSSRV